MSELAVTGSGRDVDPTPQAASLRLGILGVLVVLTVAVVGLLWAKWLPYTDRALIPAGPVTVEHVDADAHTCTVQVVFAGGASWEVRAVPEGDGWLVDGWDDGS